jgi:hypothetical protein
MAFQMTGITNVLLGPSDPETFYPDLGANHFYSCVHRKTFVCASFFRTLTVLKVHRVFVDAPFLLRMSANLRKIAQELLAKCFEPPRNGVQQKVAFVTG